jgi:hypothetical protein
VIHQFEELWLDEKQIRNALFLNDGERVCGIVAGPQHNGSATQQRDVDEDLRQIGEWAIHQLAAIRRTRNMNHFRIAKASGRFGANSATSLPRCTPSDASARA